MPSHYRSPSSIPQKPDPVVQDHTSAPSRQKLCSKQHPPNRTRTGWKRDVPVLKKSDLKTEELAQNYDECMVEVKFHTKPFNYTIPLCLSVDKNQGWLYGNTPEHFTKDFVTIELSTLRSRKHWRKSIIRNIDWQSSTSTDLLFADCQQGRALCMKLSFRSLFAHTRIPKN